MKKLLASLLAMVMALTLMLPAFADGPDGPSSDDAYSDPPPAGRRTRSGKNWPGGWASP